MRLTQPSRGGRSPVTWVPYGRHMGQVLEWMRSLGVRGAADNARVALEERRRDDWIVASLTLRVDRIDAAIAAAARAADATAQAR